MCLPVSLKQTACLLNCSRSDAGCGESKSSGLLYWLPGTELWLAVRHTSCRFSSEYLHPAILSFFFAQTPHTACSVSDSESLKRYDHVTRRKHKTPTWTVAIALHLAGSTGVASNGDLLALLALLRHVWRDGLWHCLCM